MILSRFKKDCDGLFVEAKRSTVASNAVIPMWFIGLTILLGWNELMVLFRYPWLSVFLVIIAATAYTLYANNLASPAVSIARATLCEVGRQVQAKLREKGINIDPILDGTFIRQVTDKAGDFAAVITEQHDIKKEEEIEMDPILDEKIAD